MTNIADMPAEAGFAETLTALRVARRLTKKQLAAKMGFDPSYVSHIERGRFRPTPNFARRAELVLAAGGRLEQAYAASGVVPDLLGALDETTKSEVRIESDQVDLAFDHRGFYSITITRRIRNTGVRPITWFPVRIEVDVLPDHPNWSRLFYGQYPLSIAATGFWAQADGWPVSWVVRKSCDAYMKIGITFGRDAYSAPLLPGQQATLTCGYRIHATQWGRWLEREIRWPTDHLSVSLSFPPGTVTRLRRSEQTHAGDLLFADEAERLTETPDLAERYLWCVTNPTLGSMYRFDWNMSPLRSAAPWRYDAAA